MAKRIPAQHHPRYLDAVGAMRDYIHATEESPERRKEKIKGAKSKLVWADDMAMEFVIAKFGGALKERNQYDEAIRIERAEIQRLDRKEHRIAMHAERNARYQEMHARLDEADAAEEDAGLELDDENTYGDDEWQQEPAMLEFEERKVRDEASTQLEMLEKQMQPDNSFDGSIVNYTREYELHVDYEVPMILEYDDFDNPEKVCVMAAQEVSGAVVRHAEGRDTNELLVVHGVSCAGARQSYVLEDLSLDADVPRFATNVKSYWGDCVAVYNEHEHAIQFQLNAEAEIGGTALGDPFGMHVYVDGNVPIFVPCEVWDTGGGEPPGGYCPLGVHNHWPRPHTAYTIFAATNGSDPRIGYTLCDHPPPDPVVLECPTAVASAAASASISMLVGHDPGDDGGIVGLSDCDTKVYGLLLAIGLMVLLFTGVMLWHVVRRYKVSLTKNYKAYRRDGGEPPTDEANGAMAIFGPNST